jgi:hypothetical protein
MKLTLAHDCSPRLKKGQEVEVDRMLYAKYSETGLLVRVIGVWKKPAWLDIGWFEIGTQKPMMFYKKPRKAGER